MIIFDADDPEVLSGRYDREGYTPAERRAQARRWTGETMAKRRTRFNAKRQPKSRSKPRGPRSQALPGMEQVRSVKLDHLCESIGEHREKMNELRGMEKEDKNAALKEMRQREVTTYRHAGVELARVPGEEKLRVRTSRETATAETIEEPEDAAAGDQPGVEE